MAEINLKLFHISAYENHCEVLVYIFPMDLEKILYAENNFKKIADTEIFGSAFVDSTVWIITN